MVGHAEIEIIGNVGKEPRLYQTQNEMMVANFSVAVNETHKKDEAEKTQVTTWYRVSAWTGLSKIVGDFVNQGRRVFIKGHPKADFFVDKKGVIRPIINITATKIRLLDSKEQEETVASSDEAVDFVEDNLNNDLSVVDVNGSVDAIDSIDTIGEESFSVANNQPSDPKSAKVFIAPSTTSVSSSKAKTKAK